MSKTILELQKVIAEFEKDYWDAPKEKTAKTRHIVLHLTKLIGKIGAVAERQEHNLKADDDIIKTDVIPDLLYYALTLAQDYNVNLEKTFLDRLGANKKKIKGFAQERTPKS